MLNCKLYAQGGFTPAAPASPDAIIPGQMLRQPRSAQGRYGGTGTVPSFIVPHPEFHSKGEGILQSPFYQNFVSSFAHRDTGVARLGLNVIFIFIAH